MTKLAGTVVQRLPGYVGGVQESTDPAFAKTGALRAGENAWHENGQLVRRGGVRAAATYAANSLAESVAVLPFSQTGAVVIAHSQSADKHYATAHTADGSYALPVGSATESGSRVALATGWDTADAGRPVGTELFEALYVADDSAYATRRPLQKLAISGGALVATQPTFALGGGPAAVLKPKGCFTFASVLFIFGYGSEDSGDEPHLMRHSLLGTDPAGSGGFDPDAYATIGAQGQPIMAGCPGQGVALVAKESELYRITGSGAALPGWQFAIAPIDASLGVGCVNARSLVFAEGAWYGLGRDGPWRCDGQSVQLLRSNREFSWRAVGDLSTAFVVHHPRRRTVLFALPEASSSLAGTAPTVLWAWDLETNVWAPDQRAVGRINHAAAIAPTGVVLSTTPSALTQVLSDGGFQSTSVQLRWTAGLPTEPTEVWVNDTLAATVAAGITGCVLTGLTAGTAYAVKVRHAGTITTPFTSATTVYTRPNAPRLAAAYRGMSGTTFAYRITNDVTGRTGSVDTVNATSSPFSDALPNLTQGTTQRTKSPGPLAPYTSGAYEPLLLSAYLAVPDWPDAVAYSVEAPAYATVPTSGGSGAAERSPTPAQCFDASAWSESSITLQFAPWSLFPGSLSINYRKFGTTELTTVVQSVTDQTNPFTVTLTGLESGERYEVICLWTAAPGLGAGAASATTIMAYTAVPVPTATIATAGSGTPVTNITVTPPGGKAGYDTHIMSADGSFDSLYTGVASTPTTYQSTTGTCGRADRYFVRARRDGWPDGLEWSAAVVLDIVNPCVIG